MPNNFRSKINQLILLLLLFVNNLDAAANQPTQQDSSLVRFNKSMGIIKEFYVNKLSDTKILDNAITGMISNLDPHSQYLKDSDYQDFLIESKGEFSGLGISVTPKNGSLLIISPLDQTPAEKAGIKAGDFLVAINGKSIREMSLSEVMNQVRGPQGSIVNLTILRKGNDHPLHFQLKREIIRIKNVRSKMLTDNFGYIRISQFQELTALAVKTAVKELQHQSKNHLRGIILDLRNNPGGLVDEAIDTVQEFLDSKHIHKFRKLIVYAEGQSPQAKFTSYANKNDILANAPIVTIINNGSASAAEIVAGALKDYKRSLIVGQQSFGKGSIQTIIPLDMQHAIKLTTALYHTPSGQIIQNVGITPDIIINDFILQEKNNPFAEVTIKKELSLQNHLSITNQKLQQYQTTDQNDNSLAKEDYQLFAALKLLQAIYYSKNT